MTLLKPFRQVVGQCSKLLTITFFEVRPNYLSIVLLDAVLVVQLIKRRQ
jgi:hypothetical protein